MRIAAVTGTRADYGIYRPLLTEIKKDDYFDISIIAIGMHLLPKFGLTYKEIEKDGFFINQKIKLPLTNDHNLIAAQSVGIAVQELAKVFNQINPDLVIVLGDRGEMLAAAIASVYQNIAVAQLHAGEVSGTVDEIVRHAITKLAHIHFTATKKSYNRLLKLGEIEDNIHLVGALSLDSIFDESKKIKTEDLSKIVGFNVNEPFFLVLQHPVSTQESKAKAQMEVTLKAIEKSKIPAIVIYSNADPGGRAMIETIDSHKRLKAFNSLPHEVYIGLMRQSLAIIGNSSSGIIESPALKKPSINIGIRQQGREKAENVLDVNHNINEIYSAILKVMIDKKFNKIVLNSSNPYGDGKSSKRIVNIFKKLKINEQLLRKKITY